MPILRDFLSTAFGGPTQAVLPLKSSPNMTQQEFYQAQQDNQRTLMGTPVDQSYMGQDPNQQQYQNDPRSGDYVAYGLQAMANRKAPPELSPGSRVKQADTSQFDPQNFQSYYAMLGNITDIGKSRTAAEEARQAYKQQQARQAALNVSANVQSNSGGSYVGSIPSNPKANFRFAQEIAPKFGWGANELAAWYTLGMKESGWNNNIKNKHSTAYGIGQFLDSTWGAYGFVKSADPAYQVNAMATYIKRRYGSPSAALQFHLAHNWY